MDLVHYDPSAQWDAIVGIDLNPHFVFQATLKMLRINQAVKNTVICWVRSDVHLVIR